jgi:HSP20 family protein
MRKRFAKRSRTLTYVVARRMQPMAAQALRKEGAMANIIKNSGRDVEWSPMFDVWNPSFDVTESKDAYVFTADVPGVRQDDLEITTSGNRIQITGKRESASENTSDTVYTYERQYGTFTRSFTLPEGADFEHAKSELSEGVLTLVIPKLASAQAKKIPISSTKP